MLTATHQKPQLETVSSDPVAAEQVGWPHPQFQLGDERVRKGQNRNGREYEGKERERKLRRRDEYGGEERDRMQEEIRRKEWRQGRRE